MEGHFLDSLEFGELDTACSRNHESLSWRICRVPPTDGSYLSNDSLSERKTIVPSKYSYQSCGFDVSS